MPASKKVSVGWQIIFVFIPILNFWAFYRIQKLRRFVLFVAIPAIIIEIILVSPLLYLTDGPYSNFLIDKPPQEQIHQELPPYMTPIEPQVGKTNSTFQILLIAQEVGFTGFSVYLVIIWSRKWNAKFT
jgi:hypothetical protein